MSNVTYVLNQLEEAFAKVRKKYPISNKDLYHNGLIYYLNGNDGTEFDWFANGRTCEFGVLYPDEYCYAKLDLSRDGNISGYVYYPNSSVKGVFEDLGYVDEEEAAEFAAYLQKYFDDKLIWDEALVNVDFNGKVSGDRIDFFMRGDEEDDEDDEDDYDDDTMYGRSFRAPRKHLRRNPKDALNVRRMRGFRTKAPVRRSAPKKRAAPAKKRSPLPPQKNCPVKVNIRRMF